ncbi:MAG: lysyl-tRNA synthetase class 1 [Rhodothermales bacterium]|jgi:lysyl-tRNA synthetase class 1
MHWTDKLLANVDGPQIINDSKTPSGRVHVGSLRGVLIHDAVYRVLQEKGVPVEYRFGMDDFDPVDGLSKELEAQFAPYRGFPLCNVPAPDGSEATDFAEHYMSEFRGVIRDLGVDVSYYRMRDVYRSGQFNEAIDRILRSVDIVREAYVKVSKTGRDLSNWYPFQPICENCGKIGTTEVHAYDGEEVTYTCHPSMVEWAKGCGHKGKVSPFDGKGKLPWKLEWVAKWNGFPVTIEGAGKDHSTKGGSRDVASMCLRRIFGGQPPLNVPYEFFLIDGLKMTSSGGKGASARDIADFLPPEALRFLMLKSPPNRPVNFKPNELFTLKLFNELDRFHSTVHSEKATDDMRRLWGLAALWDKGPYFDASFQLVSTIVQMPHLDLVAEIERQKGAPLDEVERRQLARRAESARFWLAHFADDSERTVLQDGLPESAADLSATQCAFLHRLADALVDCEWESVALQNAIFEVARCTPIKQPLAFNAIYRVVLDRDAGPKAGNLLAFLDRDFVLTRLREVELNLAAFMSESAVELATVQEWLKKQGEKVGSVSCEVVTTAGVAVEVHVELADGKMHLHRVSATDLSAAEQVQAELGC